MSTVREINHPDELEPLRLQWNALLPGTPGASFFHSLDWLETYWRHFGADQRLRVLVVMSGGRAVGILPLVERMRKRRLGHVRVLTYPLDDWGSFYGPIGPNPAATLLAGLGHVARSEHDWDLVELAWVDAEGSDRGRTPGAMRNAGFGAMAERQQGSALVELSHYDGWHAYFASRTSRWRNNVRRSEKKLAQQGEIQYVRYRPAGIAEGDDDPRFDLYDLCEQIAQESWQGDSRTGTTLTHADIRPFLRDCHQRAARAGALDLNLLYVGEQPAAFNYAYHYRGNVFGLRTGFLADFDGAGSVLQARMIADSLARHDTLYDLGPGYLDCKRYWQTRTQYGYRYTHFNRRGTRAQLTRLKRNAHVWWQSARQWMHVPADLEPAAASQSATAQSALVVAAMQPELPTL